MPLGNVEDVSLAEAREKATAARALVRRKLDPRVQATRRAAVPTFTSAAARWRTGAVGARVRMPASGCNR
jgi:hypothetical protein